MRSTLIAAALIAAAAAGTGAQDWTQWRGPSRSGRTASFKPPVEWPARPTRVWRVPAGEGHASPVVSGTRVYVWSRVGEREVLSAFDITTGKAVWQQAQDAPYQMNPAATAHGKGPKSTPLVHRGRIYTLGIGGILTAFNEPDGVVVWRRDFRKEFPASSPSFGAAMSPVAEGNLVIAHVGGEGNGALTAFDAATGATRWSWKGDGPGYASPVIAEIGGVRQLITQSQSRLVGIAAADGALLWQLPFTTDYDQNSVTPIVADGLVIYGGLAKPTRAIRVVPAAGKWTTTEVWANADVPLYMNTPVETGGVLYGLTHRNRGQFFAVDVRTGGLLWVSPGRQAENAAIAVAGDFVIAATTDGELVVWRRAAKTFELLRKYTVSDSPVWAHPAPAGSGLLIKDAATLSYWTF